MLNKRHAIFYGKIVFEVDMKKFILNADDLGKSEFHNNAVLEGFKKGLLKSASVMTNMPSYKDALYRVVMPNPNLGVGVHLNLIEGKAINSKLNLLCDKYNSFNNGYLSLLLKSKNKTFLAQVEKEFRSQIEIALETFQPSHLDSHVHVHSIPNIFEIVAKLALEYNIKQIRTQNEIPYFILGYKYNPINLVKVFLLNYFSLKNKQVVKKYNLKTNDYLLGVGYTSMMNSNTILEGLKKVKNADVVEALIHPCVYYDDTIDSHTKEFEITKDNMLKDLIEMMDYQITNYIE